MMSGSIVNTDDIKVRMSVIDGDLWAKPAIEKKLPPDARKL
jgi:hypothetical protein